MAEGKLDGKFEGQSERAMEFAGLEALYKRKDGILAGPFIFTFDVTVPQSEGSFDGCCCRVEIRQGPIERLCFCLAFRCVGIAWPLCYHKLNDC